MDSILISIKKLLGIAEDYTAFDDDIIIHINSVFSILTQLGVGPENGFSIIDEREVWSDYSDDLNTIQMIKSYIYLKVKKLFDPPQSGILTNSNDALIQELEWRINVAVDPKKEVPPNV